MNPCKKLLLSVLDDIRVNGRLVDVLTEFTPGNVLPVISMSESGGKGHLETLTMPVYTTLDEGHPCFDPNDPGILFGTGVCEVDFFETNLVCHVWAESNGERDELIAGMLETLTNFWHRPHTTVENVRIKNIGGVTDLDQYGGYPPLYHSTIPLVMVFEVTHTRAVQPICHIQKKRE